MTLPGFARPRTPVLFVHWGDEGIRGSERVLLDLLAKLDRDTYPPFLWCNAESMAAAARELGVPAKVTRMPILLGWDAPRMDVAGYRALVRQGLQLIRAHGARVVHANSGAPNQWMMAAARRARVPLVAHLHAIYKFRERCTLLLHQVPTVVGCSEAVVKPFRADRYPSARLRVVHNGVDLRRLGAGDATSLRSTLGVPGGAVLIASAGALTRIKGPDVLLRAVRVACNAEADVHLAVIGEGPDRDALGALAFELGIADRVHFLGQRSDVGAIFRDAADIVAIPSRIESFSLVAAEAGAMGRAVVATDVGGVSEVVERDRTGILVPSESPTAFGEALVRLAGDAALRRAMGDSARARVNGLFTTDRAARVFEQLYTELAARPASSFGWTRLGFKVSPFARLGFSVVGRRLGMQIADA